MEYPQQGWQVKQAVAEPLEMKDDFNVRFSYSPVKDVMGLNGEHAENNNDHFS